MSSASLARAGESRFEVEGLTQFTVLGRRCPPRVSAHSYPCPCRRDRKRKVKAGFPIHVRVCMHTWKADIDIDTPSLGGALPPSLIRFSGVANILNASTGLQRLVLATAFKQDFRHLFEYGWARPRDAWPYLNDSRPPLRQTRVASRLLSRKRSSNNSSSIWAPSTCRVKILESTHVAGSCFAISIHATSSLGRKHLNAGSSSCQQEAQNLKLEQSPWQEQISTRKGLLR